MKDTVTSPLKWVAPICCIASAVPEYGHFPSSSLSHPTVSWTPGMSYGDKVQRSSQITQHVQYNHDYRIILMRLTLAAITGDIQQNLASDVCHVQHKPITHPMGFLAAANSLTTFSTWSSTDILGPSVAKLHLYKGA